MEVTIKSENGRKVYAVTYITTKAKQKEILQFAKDKKWEYGYGSDAKKVRYAYFARYNKTPVSLITQTSDEAVDLYFTTIGWDDRGYTHGGADSPYRKFCMYNITNYH